MKFPRIFACSALIAPLFCGIVSGSLHIETLPVVKVTPGSAASLNFTDYIINSSTDTYLKVRVLPRRRNDKVKIAYDPETGALNISAVPSFRGVEVVRAAVTNSLNETADGAVIIIPSKKRARTFSFTPQGPVKKVSVAGDFNGWNQSAMPLLDKDGGGVFTAEAEIYPGTYNYKFVVDGRWVPDPANPQSVSDGFGGYNSVVNVDGDNSYPGEFTGISRKKDEKTGQRRYVLKYVPAAAPVTGKKSYLDITTVLVLMDNKVLTGREYEPDMSGERLIIRPPALLRSPAPGRDRNWIRVFAMDRKGNAIKPFCFVDGTGSIAGGAWEDAVIYSVLVDRFNDGDKTNNNPVNDPEVEPALNYQGGDFRGVTEKIKSGYFDRAGINALWLSPVYKNPELAYRITSPPFKKSAGYHGCWPVSLENTEERFGTMDELKELVSAAHEKGMKVVLDVIVNNVHKENPVYREYTTWFSPLILSGGRKNLRLFDERPLDTWFDDFLPDFDYRNNPDAVEFMTGNCARLAKQTGVDGFRVYALDYVPSVFIRELRKKMPGFYLAGDSTASREKIMENTGPAALNGQIDFPLYWAVRDAFGGEASPLNLESEREKSENEFGAPGVIMSPMLGAGDSQRFISSSDHNRLRMAFAFLMTLPGAPAVYYGDEIGIGEGMPPDTRRKMKFDSELSAEETKTLKFFSTMTRVRREHLAVRYGKHVILELNGTTYIYLKQYFDDFVIVAMNFAGDARELTVALPEHLRLKREFTDAVTQKKYLLKTGKFSIRVPAFACAVLY